MMQTTELSAFLKVEVESESLTFANGGSPNAISHLLTKQKVGYRDLSVRATRLPFDGRVPLGFRDSYKHEGQTRFGRRLAYIHP